MKVSFFLERREKCLNTAYMFVFRYYLNWNDVTLFSKLMVYRENVSVLMSIRITQQT